MERKLGGGQSRDHAEVKLTLLVDVALVVLTIFMVATPLMVRQVNLQLTSVQRVAIKSPTTRTAAASAVSRVGWESSRTMPAVAATSGCSAQ